MGKRGQPATIKINFKNTKDTTTATNACSGKIGVYIPFPLPESNSCVAKGGGLHCPLKAGEMQSFTYELPVQSYYPAINVIVRWQIKDDQNQDLVCIAFQAKLV